MMTIITCIQFARFFFSILLFFIFCFCLLREEKKFNILCLMWLFNLFVVNTKTAPSQMFFFLPSSPLFLIYEMRNIFPLFFGWFSTPHEHTNILVIATVVNWKTYRLSIFIGWCWWLRGDATNEKTNYSNSTI